MLLGRERVKSCGFDLNHEEGTGVNEILANLSDVQRQTVELIQQLVEEQGLTYGDLTIERIKSARREAGMSAGSNTDIMQIKQRWAEIYGIEPTSARIISDVKEKLLQRVMDSIDEELRQLYTHKMQQGVEKAQEKQQEAETEAAQLNTELRATQVQLTEVQATLDKRDTQLEELLLEKEQLLSEKRELDKETATLRVKVTTGEKTIAEKTKEVERFEHTVDGLRDEMEKQRQSQLTVLDERVQEVKRATKTIEELRRENTLQNKEQATLTQNLTKANETITLFETKITEIQNTHQEVIETKVDALKTLQNQTEQQRMTIENLTKALDKERTLRVEQSEGLITQIEHLIAKSQEEQAKKKDKSQA